jgi:hypothetical protein
MADFQFRELGGALFRNDRATSEKHPSHRGSLTVNGVTYEVAAWVKEGKTGRFFSLQLTAPDGAAAPAPGQRTRTPGEYPRAQKQQGGPRRPLNTSDDIPF